MRSTIAWSDALLSDAERAFFDRMSVFSGGCTLEAAEAVCNPGNELGDTLTLAEALLDASLVHAQAAPDGETRLQLLQTIGEYAGESLAADGEREPAMNRHGEHFLFLAEQAEPHLSGPDQASWIARVEQEQDNFREALAFAVDTGQTIGSFDSPARSGSSGRCAVGTSQKGDATSMERSREEEPQRPTFARRRSVKTRGLQSD